MPCSLSAPEDGWEYRAWRWRLYHWSGLDVPTQNLQSCAQNRAPSVTSRGVTAEAVMLSLPLFQYLLLRVSRNRICSLPSQHEPVLAQPELIPWDPHKHPLGESTPATASVITADFILLHIVKTTKDSSCTWWRIFSAPNSWVYVLQKGLVWFWSAY